VIVNGWQQPSAQFGDTNACVQVAWQRPGRCESAHCVEVGAEDGAVLMRASGAPDVVVSYTLAEFWAFVSAVKAGEYDGMIDSL
jgi:Domain of unknown function (DUF397)